MNWLDSREYENMLKRLDYLDGDLPAQNLSEVRRQLDKSLNTKTVGKSKELMSTVAMQEADLIVRNKSLKDKTVFAIVNESNRLGHVITKEDVRSGDVYSAFERASLGGTLVRSVTELVEQEAMYGWRELRKDLGMNAGKEYTATGGAALISIVSTVLIAFPAAAYNDMPLAAALSVLVMLSLMALPERFTKRENRIQAAYQTIALHEAGWELAVQGMLNYGDTAQISVKTPVKTPTKSLDSRLAEVRAIRERLDNEWFDYEMDTEAYFLTKPLLRDLNVPETAAYREAMNVLYSAVDALDGSVTETKLSNAEVSAENALIAWGAANDKALEIGVSDRTPSERAALRRLNGLVSQIQNPATLKQCGAG